MTGPRAEGCGAVRRRGDAHAGARDTTTGGAAQHIFPSGEGRWEKLTVLATGAGGGAPAERPCVGRTCPALGSPPAMHEKSPRRCQWRKTGGEHLSETQGGVCVTSTPTEVPGRCLVDCRCAGDWPEAPGRSEGVRAPGRLRAEGRAEGRAERGAGRGAAAGPRAGSVRSARAGRGRHAPLFRALSRLLVVSNVGYSGGQGRALRRLRCAMREHRGPGDQLPRKAQTRKGRLRRTITENTE